MKVHKLGYIVYFRVDDDPLHQPARAIQPDRSNQNEHQHTCRLIHQNIPAQVEGTNEEAPVCTMKHEFDYLSSYQITVGLVRLNLLSRVFLEIRHECLRGGNGGAGETEMFPEPPLPDGTATGDSQLLPY